MIKGKNLATKGNTKQNDLLKITIIYNYWNARDNPLLFGTVGRKGGYVIGAPLNYEKTANIRGHSWSN